VIPVSKFSVLKLVITKFSITTDVLMCFFIHLKLPRMATYIKPLAFSTILEIFMMEAIGHIHLGIVDVILGNVVQGYPLSPYLYG